MLKSLAANDRILLGQFGPDVAAMAWWTVEEGCISKLLAYCVHPAYRDEGRTSTDLLRFMIEDRFLVAKQHLFPASWSGAWGTRRTGPASGPSSALDSARFPATLRRYGGWNSRAGCHEAARRLDTTVASLR